MDGEDEHFSRLGEERKRLKTWARTYKDEVAQLDEPPGSGGHKTKTLPEEEEKRKRRAEEHRITAQVLDKLVSGTLPEELVLQVLEHVVDGRAPRLKLADERSLPIASRKLLGTSRSARQLLPTIEQAILRRTCMRLDIAFIRQPGGGGEPIAQVPDFVSRLPAHIRHLGLAGHIEICRNRMSYPITIFRFTRGASSLARAFPELQTFVLVLTFNLDDDLGPLVDPIMDTRCFCGYTATTTHRELIMKMLAAIYASGPGRRTYFKLVLDFYGKQYESQEILIQPSGAAVDVQLYDADTEAVQSMAEVLRAASEVKYIEHKTGDGTSDGSLPTQSASSYRIRDNEDMALLEEEAVVVG